MVSTWAYFMLYYSSNISTSDAMNGVWRSFTNSSDTTKLIGINVFKRIKYYPYVSIITVRLKYEELSRLFGSV